MTRLLREECRLPSEVLVRINVSVWETSDTRLSTNGSIVPLQCTSPDFTVYKGKKQTLILSGTSVNGSR